LAVQARPAYPSEDRRVADAFNLEASICVVEELPPDFLALALHDEAKGMATNPAERHGLIFIIQRDDPSLEPAQLIANYEDGPNLLRTAVTGMTRDQLLARPIAGKWSTLEVVCHLSDSEQFFADRIKRTLAMSRPLLLGADPEPYPESVRYHDRNLEEELALVALTRRQVARILKLIPDEAWQRTAVHSEGGLVTLRQLSLHATRHLIHHVRHIEEKREALAAAARPQPAPAGASPNGGPHEVARRGDFLISTDPARLDVPLIHDFLANRSYWAAGRPLEVVRRSFASSLCFGLYQGQQQVGLARVVTDRATFAWLCDVFVLEAYRGRGLAKWLIEAVMSHPDLQGLRRVLLATLDAHGLYQRYGFTPLADPSKFMEVFRPDV
jgi:GNAT superfamily N-acetyltransferase